MKVKRQRNKDNLGIFLGFIVSYKVSVAQREKREGEEMFRFIEDNVLGPFNGQIQGIAYFTA